MRVQQIREETNTKIDLPTENSNSEMIVITGRKGNCEAARERILAIQRELVRPLYVCLWFEASCLDFINLFPLPACSCSLDL